MAGGGIHLFVYGTLLRGETYHHRLMEKARFLGKTSTAAGYELLDVGDFPAMVAGGEGIVVGELYDIDAPTLKAIDSLEGHPLLYQRTAISLDDGKEALGYLWSAGARGPYPFIPGGDWQAYRQRK